MKVDAKYKYMSKEKRKEVREGYKNSKLGQSKNRLFIRLIIEGLFCLIFGISVIIYSIIVGNEWYHYGLAITFLLAGSLFIIGEVVMKRADYDRYISQMSKKRK